MVKVVVPRRAYCPSHREAALVSTQIYRLKDYDLACSAQTCDGGKFEPSLVISRHIWASRPRMIAMRRGAHLTAHAAIESASVQGVEWVTNYGRRLLAPERSSSNLSVAPSPSRRPR